MLELELQKRWVVIVTMSMILHVQLQWRGHGDLGFSGPSVKKVVSPAVNLARDESCAVH